jgi:hypothetical protein
MKEVENIKHQKFFKYKKPKFVSLNGDLARLLEDDFKHCSEEDINEILKRVEHFLLNRGNSKVLIYIQWLTKIFLLQNPG